MRSKILNPQDPRVLKTKKQFREAFKELILIYDDFLSISVKELCDKAGLNRKTFYFHYKQVDDLLIDIQDEAIEDLYNRIKDLNFHQDAKEVVRVYFDMNESNPVYKKMAISSVYFFSKELYRKRLIEFLIAKGKFNKPGESNSTLVDFLAYFYDMTIYTMYKRWVTKNYPLSKEEVINLTADLLKNGFSIYHKQ